MRLHIILLRKLLLFSLIGLLFSACLGDTSDKSVKKKLISLTSKYKNKDFSGELARFNIQPKKDFCIVTFVDATCSSCLSKLKHWKENIIPNYSENKIEYYFILSARDSLVIDYIFNEMDFEIPNIIYIEENKFYDDFPFISFEEGILSVVFDKYAKIISIESPTIMNSFIIALPTNS